MGPPLVFVGLVAAEVGLAVLLPRPRIGPAALCALGLLPLAAGVRLHREADRAFQAAATTRATRGIPRTLVTDGVYARSRNPMYLGGALFLTGLAVLLGPWAGLAVPVLYVPLARRLWIGPEEELLEARFGPEWLAYRVEVRRWL